MLALQAGGPSSIPSIMVSPHSSTSEPREESEISQVEHSHQIHDRPHTETELAVSASLVTRFIEKLHRLVL